MDITRKGENFSEELAREVSQSANINPPEVVEGSLTELWKGTRDRIVVM